MYTQGYPQNVPYGSQYGAPAYGAPPMNPYATNYQAPPQQPPQVNPYVTGRGPAYGDPPMNPYATNFQAPPQQIPQQPPRQLTGWYSQYLTQVHPQDMQRFQQWFLSVDADKSGSIQSQELANIKFNDKPIGIQVASKLIKVFDKDHSGSIDFNEYVALQRFLEHMQNAFFSADRDKSGTIDAQEIHVALTQAGFQLSMTTIQAAVAKFDQTRRGVDFPNFLFLCAHLAHCRSIFEWNDAQQTGRMQLSYDAFCHIGIDLI